MKFLIQTQKGQIIHDFSFTLVESLKYQNWYMGTKDFQPIFTDNPCPERRPDVIPCGSVEFVTYYLETYHSQIKPRNVPIELMTSEFAMRKVINGVAKDIEEPSFVKSNERIKSFAGIVNSKEDAPFGDLQISSLIDIDSEWRGFVYKNKLVGLQNYSGEFTMFPNVTTIEKMIEAFKPSAPIAYTLDVGINSTGTFVIEVHDFFSCGLYGFCDHRIYPFMLSRWFHEFVKK